MAKWTKIWALGWMVLTVGLAAPVKVVAEPHVVASIKPLHALVAGVMRGVGSPQLLLDDTQSPHYFALKPSQARQLQKADIVFWIDPMLETPLAKLLGHMAPDAQHVAMMDQLGLVLHPNANAAAHANDRASTHNQDPEHEHDHEHDGHAKVNPHIWLDTSNAQKMVVLIRDRLATSDPAHAGDYAANAETLLQRLSDLENTAAAKLAGVKALRFIMQHDAFIYTERQFGLSAGLVVAADHDTPPGTQHLQALRDLVASGSIACVFSEPLGTPSQIDIIVGASSVRRATVDPVGIGLAAGPDLYFTMMTANFDAMARCLAGGAG